MTEQALIRSILERVQNGEKEIDITPKDADAHTEITLKDTMKMLDERGLINVTHKHLGGRWELDGLTLSGKAYLESMDE